MKFFRNDNVVFGLSTINAGSFCEKNILNIALSTLLAVCCTLLILAVQRRMPGAEKTEAEQTPAASAESGASMELQGYANVLDYGQTQRAMRTARSAFRTLCATAGCCIFRRGTYRIDQLTISGSVTLQGAGTTVRYSRRAT